MPILDIKARSESGKWYNVEVQVTDELHYDKRSLYYWSKVYAEQLKEGEKYSKLEKTISIHVLNFNALEEAPYHNVFRVLNTESKRMFSDMLELHYIELKKVPEDYSNMKSSLGRWACFLAKSEAYSVEDLPAPFREDPLIKNAAEALGTTRLDEDQWEIYEAPFEMAARRNICPPFCGDAGRETRPEKRGADGQFIHSQQHAPIGSRSVYDHASHGSASRRD